MALKRRRYRKMRFCEKWPILVLSLLFLAGGNAYAQDSPASVEEVFEDPEYYEEEEPAVSQKSVSDFKAHQEEYLGTTVEKKDFDQKKWEELSKGLDYSEHKDRTKEDEEREMKNKKEKKRVENRGPISTGTAQGLLNVFQGLGIILILVLVVVLVAYIMKSGMLRANPSTAQLSMRIEDAEEKLMETELDKFLREALAAGDYKLATRVYYLMVIKKLSSKNLITWKKDKTNNAYLSEMRAHPSFSTFAAVTQIYERVWFGDVSLSGADFVGVKTSFDQYLKT